MGGSHERGKYYYHLAIYLVADDERVADRVCPSETAPDGLKSSKMFIAPNPGEHKRYVGCVAIAF